MPHRKVDFSHSQAAFDLLCPFVSLLLLPRELRWAKPVMMPQQASIFHQRRPGENCPVMAAIWTRTESFNSAASSGLKLYIQVIWQKELDVRSPQTVKCTEDMLFPSFPLPSDVLHRGPLRLHCNSWMAVTCWVWWMKACLKQTDSGWFSFQRASGWCNWSGQSEDGMISPSQIHTHLPSSPSPDCQAIELSTSESTNGTPSWLETSSRCSELFSFQRALLKLFKSLLWCAEEQGRVSKKCLVCLSL